jgi:hypothetical protein
MLLGNPIFNNIRIIVNEASWTEKKVLKIWAISSNKQTKIPKGNYQVILEYWIRNKFKVPFHMYIED